MFKNNNTNDKNIIYKKNENRKIWTMLIKLIQVTNTTIFTQC